MIFCFFVFFEINEVIGGFVEYNKCGMFGVVDSLFGFFLKLELFF